MDLENEKKMTKLEADMGHMMDLLIEIKDTLKNLDNTYVRKTELNIMINQLNEKIIALQNAKNNLPSWISSIVAIVAVVIAYFK